MQIIETSKGTVGLKHEATIINNASTFLDFLASSQTDILAISRNNLSPLFFDLRSGLAGEILQKVATYKKYLVIIGAFDDLSENFKALIQESNLHGQIVFAPDIEQGILLIKR